MRKTNNKNKATMEKKYEMLMDDCVTTDYGGARHKLYRIKALREFGAVNRGDIGGYIEKEDNLSHSGTCWVYGDARVCGNARVTHDSSVGGEARVMDNATIKDSASVMNDTEVRDNATVCDFACVYGGATINGDAIIRDYACVYGNAIVGGLTIIENFACVSGHAVVRGDALVKEMTSVYGEAQIRGNAILDDDSDYIVFKNWWSSGRYFTWTRSNNMWAVGCFYGTGEELIEKAYKDSDISGREYERVVRYTEGIMQDYDNRK